MEVRALTEADAEAWLALRLRALREHPDAFVATPEETESLPDVKKRFATARDDESIVVGAFDPHLVGIVGCYRLEATKERHIARIWGMYIAPEARGRGTGRLMLDVVITLTREWPELDHLWLHVMRHQTAARRLYLSCGFEVIGSHPRVLRVGDCYYDEDQMVFRLR